MFLFRKPPPASIQTFIASQHREAFSYPEVGATRHGVPAGYTVDHNRVRLGAGEEVFESAVAAFRRWEMFRLGWVELCWPDAPIETGTTVAILARHLGFWSLHAARIVYRVDEDGPVRRYGFAYGTLTEHGERGEERFTVGWNRADDSVWYELYAFSRPRHWLAKLGYPVTRWYQKRFARDSKRVMLSASGRS